MAEFRRGLAGEPYDAVVDTQGLLKSALITRFARGSGTAWTARARASRSRRASTTGVHAVPRGQHAVERNRRLTAAALGYALNEHVHYGLRNALTTRAGAYSVLLTMTSRADKLWPESRWIELGKALAQPVVLPWGSEEERARAERIAAALRQAVVPQRMTLEALAEVLANARAWLAWIAGSRTSRLRSACRRSRIFCGSDPALTGRLRRTARKQPGQRGQAAGGVRSAEAPAVRSVYTAVLSAALPLLLLRLWWRGRREPGYREHVGERLGRYDLPRREKLVWVHAVSVGEARAAAPLVRGLQQALPDHGLLVTCTTAAGRATLEQLYGETVQAAFLPYDFPGAVQAVPRSISVRGSASSWRPRSGPTCLPGAPATACRWCSPTRACRRNRPAATRAGAVSPSLPSPAWRAVCAQSEADAERLRALGASRVAGDRQPEVRRRARCRGRLEAGRAWRAALGRPVVLLASTREGEERLLLEHLDRVPAEALVLVVPRHPQRFDEVATLAQSRRTRSRAVPAAGDRVHLGDTMGEMAFYFGAADVAVIGGSFLPLGGQNLIEALAAGAPVVLGPSMFNFAEATRLALAAGAAVQVRRCRRRDALRQPSCLRRRPRARGDVRGGQAALRGAPRRDAAAPSRSACEACSGR